MFVRCGIELFLFSHGYIYNNFKGTTKVLLRWVPFGKVYWEGLSYPDHRALLWYKIWNDCLDYTI